MKKIILLPTLALLFSFTSHSKNHEIPSNFDTVNTVNSISNHSEQQQVSNAPFLTTYSLFLKLYNGNTEAAETRFYFQDGLTLGLDPGYDAGAFDQDMPLSSQLVEDNQGTNFAINAMGLESMYNQAVPLVVNQMEGQTFRIHISQSVMPENVNVYIEDILEGTFTPIVGKDFEYTAQSNLSGEGRFQVVFSSEILGGEVLASNNVFDTNSLVVFKAPNDSYLTIQGLPTVAGKISATLYNMLGMQLRTKIINPNSSSDRISTQNIPTGTYVLQLRANNQTYAKKLIL